MKPARMLAIIATVLLVMYPLSPGPVALYYSRTKQAHPLPQHVRTFYTPLIWLCHHSQAIDDAYFWYFRVWGG